MDESVCERLSLESRFRPEMPHSEKCAISSSEIVVIYTKDLFSKNYDHFF